LARVLPVKTVPRLWPTVREKCTKAKKIWISVR